MKLGLVSWNLDTSHGIGRCGLYTLPGVTLHRIPLHTRRRYPAEIEYLARVGATLRREGCDLTHPMWCLEAGRWRG
jgi:hypothetical protein